MAQIGDGMKTGSERQRIETTRGDADGVARRYNRGALLVFSQRVNTISPRERVAFLAFGELGVFTMRWESNSLMCYRLRKCACIGQFPFSPQRETTGNFFVDSGNLIHTRATGIAGSMTESLSVAEMLCVYS